jgi:hypothetical protein
MRRITQYLNPRLTEICKQAVQLEELNSKLYTYLPITLQEHCQVGSFTAGCLTIVVSDAVWASELRYSLPTLRDVLRKEAGIYQLTSIKITVATLKVTSSAKNSHKLPLSSKAREVIIACGEQCSYGPLKEALDKLGSV